MPQRPEPSTEPTIVVDLSAFAELPLSAIRPREDQPRSDAAGADVGIGRYDEPRCWYGGALFETPGHECIERRTA